MLAASADHPQPRRDANRHMVVMSRVSCPHGWRYGGTGLARAMGPVRTLVIGRREMPECGNDLNKECKRGRSVGNNSHRVV